MYKTTEKVPLLSPDITSLRAGEIKPWLTTNQSLVIVCMQARYYMPSWNIKYQILEFHCFLKIILKLCTKFSYHKSSIKPPLSNKPPPFSEEES